MKDAVYDQRSEKIILKPLIHLLHYLSVQIGVLYPHLQILYSVRSRSSGVRVENSIVSPKRSPCA